MLDLLFIWGDMCNCPNNNKNLRNRRKIENQYKLLDPVETSKFKLVHQSKYNSIDKTLITIV